MPKSDEIQVRMINNQIRCNVCDCRLVVSTICMMLRRSPGGTFDPICNSCAYEIVHSALATYDVSIYLEDAPE